MNDNNRALDFLEYARLLAIASKTNRAMAEDWAVANRRPAGAIRLLKAAVAGGSTADPAWGGAFVPDVTGAATAFQEWTGIESFLYRGINEVTFVPVPLNSRIGTFAGNATGWVVGEGRPTPLSRLHLDNLLLSSISANALIVVTDTLVQNVSRAGQITWGKLLRGALANVVDTRALSLIIDGSTPRFSSLGSDDPMNDIRALLASVQSSGSSKLYWLMSVDVAKIASTFPTLFPAMSASGGEMVGLEAVVTSGLEPGNIALLDGSGIAAGANGIEVRVSSQADIEMLDNPAQNALTGGGASMVSMFQADSTALMLTANFGVKRLRDDAVAIMDGVEWGGNSPTV